MFFNLNAEQCKQRLANNCVTVRIWTSELNLTNPACGVGHVSLEFAQDNFYISLWPQRTVSKLTESVAPEYIDNYATDFRRESRSPELIFKFYTLNSAAMTAKFYELKASTEGWCLVGSCKKKSESCVSLVWTLLETGGINKLISRLASNTVHVYESSKGSLVASGECARSNTQDSKKALLYSLEHVLHHKIKSPDAVIVELTKAKAAEYVKEPLTKELDNLYAEASPSRVADCRIL